MTHEIVNLTLLLNNRQTNTLSELWSSNCFSHSLDLQVNDCSIESLVRGEEPGVQLPLAFAIRTALRDGAGPLEEQGGQQELADLGGHDAMEATELP